MERLNRKPQLALKKEFELPDGTGIAIRNIKVSEMVNHMKSKGITQEELGMRIMASKLLVKLPGENDYKTIVYEDLLDCFNDEEMTIISSHLGEDEPKNE